MKKVTPFIPNNIKIDHEKVSSIVKESMLNTNVKFKWWHRTKNLILVCVLSTIFVGFITALIATKGYTEINEDHDITTAIALVAMTVISLVFSFFAGRDKIKIVNSINSSLDHQKIYDEIFKNCKDIKVTGFSKESMTQNIYTYKYDSIPMDARVIKGGSEIHLDVRGHEAIFSTAMFRWYRNKTNMYRNSGYLLLNTMNLKNKAEFKLSTSTKTVTNFVLRKKQKEFENQEFNKAFELFSNTHIPTGMIFTPLSMEEMIKYKKTQPSMRGWNMDKTNNMIISTFEPKDYDYGHIGIKSINKYKSINEIIYAIVQDAIGDAMNIYNIIYMTLIPPML